MSSVVHVHAKKNNGKFSITGASASSVFQAKPKANTQESFENAVCKCAFERPAVQTVRIQYPDGAKTIQRLQL